MVRVHGPLRTANTQLGALVHESPDLSWWGCDHRGQCLCASLIVIVTCTAPSSQRPLGHCHCPPMVYLKPALLLSPP